MDSVLLATSRYLWRKTEVMSLYMPQLLSNFMKYGTEADIDCSGAAIVSIAVALVLCLGKKKKKAGQRDAAQGTDLACARAWLC